jgi:hypothetical protein
MRNPPSHPASHPVLLLLVPHNTLNAENKCTPFPPPLTNPPSPKVILLIPHHSLPCMKYIFTGYLLYIYKIYGPEDKIERN